MPNIGLGQYASGLQAGGRTATQDFMQGLKEIEALKTMDLDKKSKRVDTLINLMPMWEDDEKSSVAATQELQSLTGLDLSRWSENKIEIKKDLQNLDKIVSKNPELASDAIAEFNAKHGSAVLEKARAGLQEKIETQGLYAKTGLTEEEQAKVQLGLKLPEPPKLPTTLEGVLASDVSKGKRTITEAYNIKDLAAGKKGSPTKLNKLLSESKLVKPGSKEFLLYQEAIDKEVSKSGTAPSNAMVQTLAAQVVNGNLDPNMISKRGGLQQAVFTAVEDIAPGFDIIAANANAKYRTDSVNLRSRALINGIDELFDNLLVEGMSLNNYNIQLVNKAVNFFKEQTGKPEIVAFNNLRDDVIAETERILLGSGVLSDSKYQRALHNVNSAQSYKQLQAAVAQLRLVISTRLHALNVPPFEDTTKAERLGGEIKTPPPSSATGFKPAF